jgi:hypothetical protein
MLLPLAFALLAGVFIPETRAAEGDPCADPGYNCTENACMSCICPEGTVLPCETACLSANTTCYSLCTDPLFIQDCQATCDFDLTECQFLCAGPQIVPDCNGLCSGSAVVDCNGDCEGTAVVDDCGTCSGGLTGLVVNGEKDCADVCFGNATVDCGNICQGQGFINECGSCAYPGGDICGCEGTYSSCLATCDNNVTCPPGPFQQDCLIDCEVNCLIDRDICEAVTCNATEPIVTDCNGDCNGSAALDECGVCSGGGTNITAGADKDCTGICFGNTTTDCGGICNGPGVANECGSCLYDGVFFCGCFDTYNTCLDQCILDFPGVCLSDEAGSCPCFDQCIIGKAICLDLCINATSSPPVLADCVGVCGGNATDDCAGVCNGNATIDCTGTCGTTQEDCGGVCGGPGTINECGSCVYPNDDACLCQSEYDTCIDTCNTTCATDPDPAFCSLECTGVCGKEQKECEALCLAGPVVTPDCNGDCGGIAFIDDCGVCAGGNTNNTPNADQDCAGICFGNTTVDCGGLCGGPGTLNECGSCVYPNNDPCLCQTEFDTCTDTCTASCGGDPECLDECNKDCSNEQILCLDGCFAGPIVEPDCNGDCGGVAFIDDCGVCAGGNTFEVPNEDKDCAGVCFGTTILDCNGDCGGTAAVDQCGICAGGNTGVPPNVNVDCNGDCFGTAVVDDCGVCAGGNTSEVPNEDKDCAGVCFGSAIIDDCGICSGGTTGVAPNFNKDCNGECFGTAIINDCGYCVEGSTGLPLDFGDDCNGDCNGTAAIDDCGVCAGGNTLEIPNEDKDCAGVCFGNSTINACGVCGDNSNLTGCCNCPRSAGYWKTHNCFARSKNYRQNGRSLRLQRDWPGAYSGCGTEICGISFLDILWNPAKGDPWNILARQYIAALLNRERLPCIEDSNVLAELDAQIADATTVLESNCATIGKKTPTAADALALKDYLEAFNVISGPPFDTAFTSNCLDNDESNDGLDNVEEGGGNRKRGRSQSHNRINHVLEGSFEKRSLFLQKHTRTVPDCFEVQFILDNILPEGISSELLENATILPGEPLLQCIGGVTNNIAYYCDNSNPNIYPNPDCASTMNECTVCGRTFLDLASENPTNTNNDSVVYLAQQWVAAVMNIRAGACIPQVTADALVDGLALLESTCVDITPSKRNSVTLRGHNTSLDIVPPTSELGQVLMDIHDQLESYNNQEWGPFEDLLTELNITLKEYPEDCSESTQRSYLIWAIIVTVLLGIGLCVGFFAFFVMCVVRTRKNRRYPVVDDSRKRKSLPPTPVRGRQGEARRRRRGGGF